MTAAGLRRAASLVAIVVALGGVAAAQSGSELGRDIERRFNVLLLREGVVLEPRNASRGVRSIEVTDAGIAVDGQPVTGAELRDRLGSDAELVRIWAMTLVGALAEGPVTPLAEVTYFEPASEPSSPGRPTNGSAPLNGRNGD